MTILKQADESRTQTQRQANRRALTLHTALASSTLMLAACFAGCGGSDSSSDANGPTGAAGDGSVGGESGSGGSSTAKAGSGGSAHAGAASGHGGSSGVGGAAGKAQAGGSGGTGTGGHAAGSGTGGSKGGNSAAGGMSAQGGAASGSGGSPAAGAGGVSTAGTGGAPGQGAGGDTNGGNAGMDAAGGSPGTGGDSTAGGTTSAGGTGTGGNAGGSTGGSSGVTKQSWVWVYTDWTASAAAITSHASSFTHISPTFYDLNATYNGGLVPYWNCSTSSPCKYEGKTPAEYTAELTQAGLLVVPAIYAGADNSGTDANVKDILDDKNGEAESFITAMVAEAVTQGYAGYNLDWELGSIGKDYADKFVSFVNAFKVGLQAHNMILTADAIVSNINGTWCSSNNGYMDFAKLSGSSIDSIIIEDYTASLGTATTSCQSAILSSTNPISCPLNAAQSDVVFTGVLDFMCSNLPYDKVVIGMQSDSTNTNPIAGAAFSALESYGFTGVAVWPQVETKELMSSKGLVASQGDWYGVLKAFLGQLSLGGIRPFAIWGRCALAPDPVAQEGTWAVPS